MSHPTSHLLQILDWTMNLWDFKRFRLNGPALAHVYKSQGTLAKLVGTAGREIHRETGLRAAGRRGWSLGPSVGSPRELRQPTSENPASRLCSSISLPPRTQQGTGGFTG